MNVTRAVTATIAVVGLSATALLAAVPASAAGDTISVAKATLVNRGLSLDVSVLYNCTYAPGPDESVFVSGEVDQVTRGAVPVIIRGFVEQGAFPVTCDGAAHSIVLRLFPGPQGQYPWEVGSAVADLRLTAGQPFGFPQTTIASVSREMKVARK